MGVPVAPKTARSLGKAIEEAVGLQPFVERVVVRIDPSRGGTAGSGRFGYRYLTAEMLDVRLRLRVGREAVNAKLVFRPDLRYPLMSVEEPHSRRRRA